MSPAVRDTRTVEWTVSVSDAERAVKETQEDSRVVFITKGLPQTMNAASHGRPAVFRPEVLTMRWTYRRHGSRDNRRWELRGIYLTGPRILKDGETGMQQITNDYWPGRDNLPRFIEELADKYRPDGDHPFTMSCEPAYRFDRSVEIVSAATAPTDCRDDPRPIKTRRPVGAGRGGP